MEITLSEEESATLQKALRSYLSDLGPEISNTDNHRYKDGLKHERTVLEAAMAKLDHAARVPTGNEVIVVHLWWTEHHPT